MKYVFLESWDEKLFNDTPFEFFFHFWNIDLDLWPTYSWPIKVKLVSLYFTGDKLSIDTPLAICSHLKINLTLTFDPLSVDLHTPSTNLSEPWSIGTYCRNQNFKIRNRSRVIACTDRRTTLANHNYAKAP